MNRNRALVAVALLGLIGLASFAIHLSRRGAMPPAGYPQIKGWTGGHNQKWERLPFKISTPGDVPAARTPDGSPLTLAMISGDFLCSYGMGGSDIRIEPNGNCRSGWGGCEDSGSSQGLARIVDGRVEIESLSLWGRATGDKCYCVPVWWKGRVYLLGPPGDRFDGGTLEFCNAINWGDEPHEKYDGRALELLYACYETRPGAESVTSIPEAMERYILRAPIEGKLVGISPGNLRVNLGTKNGVFVGQRLFARFETGYGRWLRVTIVDEELCTVENYNDWNEGPFPPAGTPVRCEAKGAGVLQAK